MCLGKEVKAVVPGIARIQMPLGGKGRSSGDRGGILSQVSTVIKQNNKKQLGKGRVYFVLQFSGRALSPREEWSMDS